MTGSDRPPERQVGLDVLRSLAIAMVVLYHYPKRPDQLWLRAVSHYGWIGVDLFFVLSGYLVAAQLLKTFGWRAEPWSLGRFYLRRLGRILPSYLAILGVWLAVVANERASGLPDWQTLMRFLSLTQNFGIPSLFSESWSLCVEEHFYLVLPLAASGLLLLTPGRWRRSQLAFAALAALALGELCLRAVLWYEHRPDRLLALDPDAAMATYLRYLYYPSSVRLDGLLAGVAIAMAQAARPEIWERLRRHARLVTGLGAAVVAAAAAVLYARLSFLGVVLGYPLLALGFGALVAAAAADSRLYARLGRGWPTAVANLAFAVYLTHNLAFKTADALAPHLAASLPVWLAWPLLSAGLLPLYASALHRLVERPGLRLRDRWLARVAAPGGRAEPYRPRRLPLPAARE